MRDDDVVVEFLGNECEITFIRRPEIPFADSHTIEKGGDQKDKNCPGPR